MVMLLLVLLRNYSERAFGLRVVGLISMVELEVNMFLYCTTGMEVIPGHTAHPSPEMQMVETVWQ
jgi:hypothetical protein